MRSGAHKVEGVLVLWVGVLAEFTGLQGLPGPYNTFRFWVPYYDFLIIYVVKTVNPKPRLFGVKVGVQGFVAQKTFSSMKKVGFSSLRILLDP